jgi:hypothetical protein
MRVRKSALAQTIPDKLLRIRCALAALIAGAKLPAKSAHIADSLLSYGFPNLPVGNVLADTDVHNEIDLPTLISS